MHAVANNLDFLLRGLVSAQALFQGPSASEAPAQQPGFAQNLLQQLQGQPAQPGATQQQQQQQQMQSSLFEKLAQAAASNPGMQQVYPLGLMDIMAS